MEKRAYWIWLSAVLGAGARTDEILAHYPDPEALYEAGEREWRTSGVFTQRQLKNLTELNPLRARHNIEICQKNGWGFVTPSDKEYPQLLLRISSSPLVLYVQGDISYINDSVTVGVVGTRKPSNNSIALTRTICADAARARAVIVSGGALGIDSAAHEGAMLGGGKTVAVLGCGLGERYLAANEALRNEISKNGAVISEYSPFSPVTKSSFPLRNRIISGMCYGTLIIEAGEKSGSLITAGYAAEQNRDVFAVPGEVLSGAYNGANKLIRDGAKPVSCASELLEGYALLYPEKLDMKKLSIEQTRIKASPKKENPKVSPAANVPLALSENAKKLYSVLGAQPQHSDELAAQTGFAAGDVIAALTELEMEGLIEQVTGRQYRLI